MRKFYFPIDGQQEQKDVGTNLVVLRMCSNKTNLPLPLSLELVDQLNDCRNSNGV